MIYQDRFETNFLVLLFLRSTLQLKTVASIVGNDFLFFISFHCLGLAVATLR